MKIYRNVFALSDESLYILIFLVEKRSKHDFEREFRYQLIK